MTVAFLTIRVNVPDKEDWEKLKQMLKYLNRAKHLKLKLSVGDLGVLKWYVDGSHNFNWDCKEHEGVMFMMGIRLTSSYSRKIELNTRCATERELFAANMCMPEMLWTMNFI
jgi:hypothetical protein